MASIIAGFEYDIFISYRHNDNRSGWVADFVNALQEELAATIKEPLSIYFDKNPSDGLLETHSVDKSLEGKLKSLIFIPIISQTYCDPKSFAWQHELCAFNKLAKEDQMGRDIKLSNGNVASRILPVKIHDLDSEDKAIIENEIGGVLRAVEFIYKEAGVNRPLLLHEENPSKNQNQTTYRNQLNKVANAIKEITVALRPIQQSSHKSEVHFIKPSKSNNRKLAIVSLIIIILALAGYLFYPKLMSVGTSGAPEKSVAVLPFQNMSGDPEQEYFSDGIAEEILNSLAQLEGLQVTGRTSSFQFKGKNLDLKEVGERLAVSNILEGSVRKQGDQLRITVQLVSARSGYHLWSERYDRKVNDLFAIQDEIAEAVSSKLKVKLLNQVSPGVRPVSQDAYDLYIKGRYFLNQRGEGLTKGLELFKQSLAIDSSYAQAHAGVAATFAIMSFYNIIPSLECLREGKKYAMKAIALDPRSSDAYSALGFMELQLERNWPLAKAYLDKAVAFNPNNALAIAQLGNYFQWVLGQNEKAVECYTRAIQLDPLYFVTYGSMSSACLAQGQLEKALEYGQKAMTINSSSIVAINNFAASLWALNKREEAVVSLQKGLEVTKRHQGVLAQLCESLAAMGQKEKAMELYKELNDRAKSEYISPFALARVAMAMGKDAEAIRWFEKAFQEKNAGFLFWRGNDDPRLKTIRDQMKFPE